MGLLAAAVALTLMVDAPASLRSAAERIRGIDRANLEASLKDAALEVPATVQVTLMLESDPAARRGAPWLVGRAFGTGHILIIPERVMRYPYDSLESVLRHEVVHLALNATAQGWPLPRWFHEGVATSVDAGWGAAGEMRLLVAALTGPTIDDVSGLFDSDSQQGTELAYLLSTALVNSVRERHGAGAPGRIAARFAQALRACVLQNPHAAIARCNPRVVFTRAFRDETGETPDAAATIAWRSYRNGLRWVPAIASASALWMFILALAVLAYVARRRRRRRARQRWAGEEHEPRATIPRSPPHT